MSDIKVALSTTKHMLRTEEGLNKIQALHVPVCSAQFFSGMFLGTGRDAEIMESSLAQTCMSMTKEVAVDSEKRTVFVAEDLKSIDTYLVEYTDSVKGEYSDDFFKRWDETHTMLFEFTALNWADKSGTTKVVFSIKGCWIQDRWINIDVLASPTLHMISE